MQANVRYCLAAVNFYTYVKEIEVQRKKKNNKYIKSSPAAGKKPTNHIYVF